MAKIITIAFFILIAAVSPAGAIEDTIHNRLVQAERYMSIVPMGEIMTDTVDETAKLLKEEDRALFKRLVNENLDLKALEKSVTHLMVRHFTADEIKALTDFYESPAGRSVMKKIGAYTADTIPVIRDALTKAIEKPKNKTSFP